jgi:hypothetical protein
MKPAHSVCLLGAFAVLFAAAPALAQSVPAKILSGDTKVETVAGYQGTDPLPRPEKTVIYDFRVAPESVTMDDSAAARLTQRRALRRGSDDESSALDVAGQVRVSFSKALIDQLRKLPMPVEMAPGAESGVPPNTLIVHGEFTAVNQGNSTKRIMIGFGRGASDVQADVTVSLITETQPIVLSEFKLKSESGKKPGAAATMGVGSLAVGAAAGDVGEKKASVEGDAARMAKAVAKQIADIMVARKWIPPLAPDPAPQ